MVIKAASCIVLFVALIFITAPAEAIIYTFSDRDFIGGASWGSMEITASGDSQLTVTYTASAPSLIGADSQATGFGFTFIPSTMTPSSVGNGGDPALNWVRLTNLNPIPQPSNRDEFLPTIITDNSFFFGVTEGQANTINPPGIRPGNSDTYFLNFTGLGSSLIGSDLSSFIALTGVRLQSLPNSINDGSLFLVGREETSRVPEPATLLLVGSGLLGFGIFASKRRK